MARYPGKFEAADDEDIARILYDAAGHGMADEESGSVQERGVWSALFKGVEVRPGDDPEIQDGFPGGYILEEDSQGFVTYTEFDSDEEIEKAWAWIEEQNAEFYEEGEDEEEEE